MPLPHLAPPLLPAPPSWYPGHMTQFARMLPALLTRTDIVLELRDARLPLTSINRTFEGALQRWRADRVRLSEQAALASPYATARVCERIVVFNKRDLVPRWGLEPFCKAMNEKFPEQRVLFASWNKAQDIKTLSSMLVNIAKEHPHMREMNVLVVGMPNVGKSTLLNALRNIGISGPTPKALRTSAQPGLTRALSTRLKLSQEPLVYAFDTPGVMLPFLGRGERGAERGVKLALIAGIKEGLYDIETLAAYLLYRLNVLNSASPAYLSLLPSSTPPMADVDAFLELLATRLGMLKRGGIADAQRAATWFVKWWREEGAIAYASAAPPFRASLAEGASPAQRAGWGFDLEWEVSPEDAAQPDRDAVVQRKMEGCIDAYMLEGQREESEGGGTSATQEKKKMLQERAAKRALRSKAKFASKRRG
ncbi:P-loop containing nucleoside triphosphate hydrolase protein [Amylostereum chailletii]|nr:P-loop containing nucleoside triphosphate hydrolase protein [Amylostereum chailletii]